MEFGQGSSASTWASSDLVTKYAAGTTIALTGVWTGSTAITGSTYPSLTATTPVCLITSCTPTIEGPGIIMLSVEFTVLDNGSNAPLQIAYVSSENVTS
jgi:hypothetical protein